VCVRAFVHDDVRSLLFVVIVYNYINLIIPSYRCARFYNVIIIGDEDNAILAEYFRISWLSNVWLVSHIIK